MSKRSDDVSLKAWKRRMGEERQHAAAAKPRREIWRRWGFDAQAERRRLVAEQRFRASRAEQRQCPE